jgi:hypothetical protein
VSGRRHRPAAGGSNAAVVSIGTRRPDYSGFACGQVAAARRALGLDHAGFAALIGGMLGWDVPPETAAAWEDDVTPPGDVVLACAVAAQGLPGPAVPLLVDRPPAFPVKALAGPWVTSYQFSHAGEPHYHADIAHVTAGPGDRIQAVNHPPEPRSEGRGRSFRNVISGRLSGRHLIGEWMNTSDTRYYGALMLAVLPGETVMDGPYSGVKSDVEVSTGRWRWVRLAPGPVPPPGFTLRDPHELYDLVMNHSQYGVPLTLADVREGNPGSADEG